MLLLMLATCCSVMGLCDGSLCAKNAHDRQRHHDDDDDDDDDANDDDADDDDADAGSSYAHPATTAMQSHLYTKTSSAQIHAVQRKTHTCCGHRRHVVQMSQPHRWRPHPVTRATTQQHRHEAPLQRSTRVYVDTQAGAITFVRIASNYCKHTQKTHKYILLATTSDVHHVVHHHPVSAVESKNIQKCASRLKSVHPLLAATQQYNKTQIASSHNIRFRPIYRANPYHMQSAFSSGCALSTSIHKHPTRTHSRCCPFLSKFPFRLTQAHNAKLRLDSFSR